MGDPKVKMEAGESSLVHPNRAAIAEAPLPEWKRCDGDTPLKQVGVKEGAVKYGVDFLKELKQTLKNHVAAIPSCQPRIEKIVTIEERRKEFSVLVGFLGSTGAGKSTLINALIGHNQLLPTSSHRASTAVAVEIAFNKSNVPFRAQVEYITIQEWREELDQLFTDLDTDPNAEDGDDDQADDERIARINEVFDKVKTVYPNIRTKEKLKSFTVDMLLDDRTIRNVFGSTETIDGTRRGEFSDAIRPYIDSGDSGETDSALWPLVKLVKIFVKSPLLQNGIVLVDLPGGGDSNTARGRCAEAYYKELSVIAIVSNSTRGISEKNAHDLFDKFIKRNMQLDGMFKAGSLCFILSQTDVSFDFKHHIKQYPILQANIKEDLDLVAGFNKKINDIEGQLENARETRRKNKKLAESLTKEIEEVKELLKRASTGSSQTEQKRKRSIDDNDDSPSLASSTQMSLRAQLTRLEKRVEEAQTLAEGEPKKEKSFVKRIGFLETAINHARSRIRAACIKHRNMLSVNAIRKDYEQTLKEMGRQATDPIEVFPCAAAVHLKYLRRPKMRQIGFPNLEDTQIGSLRDWLVSTTLKTRNQYAQSFLEDVDNLITSLSPFLNDTYGDTKMTPEMREVWESRVEASSKELRQKFSDLNAACSNDLKQLVFNTLYSKLSEAEKRAAVASRARVEKWGSMHWSTHKCVNRGLGRWMDCHGTDHKWNDELVLDLTKPLLEPWDQTFFVKLPSALTRFAKEAGQLIESFAVAFDSSAYPDVANAIDLLRDSILKSRKILKHQSKIVSAELDKAIKNTHRCASPAIRNFLEPMYNQCASEKGRGHFKRNRDTHRATIKKSGVAMHLAGSEAIRYSVDELLDTIPEKLKKGYCVVLSEIQDNVKDFFEHNSSTGIRTTARKAVSVTKLKLQRDSAVHFEDLYKNWNSTAPISFQPEIPDSDDGLDDDPDLVRMDKGAETESDYDDEL